MPIAVESGSILLSGMPLGARLARGCSISNVAVWYPRLPTDVQSHTMPIAVEAGSMLLSGMPLGTRLAGGYSIPNVAIADVAGRCLVTLEDRWEFGGSRGR